MSNPAQTGGRPSRRTFLFAGAAALVVGAGGGIASGFRWTKPKAPPRQQEPFPLAVALNAEDRLIWLIDHVTDATPAQRALLEHIRADHVEHQRVLTSLIPVGAQLATIAPPAQMPGSVSELVGEEQRWATDAASSAAKNFTGRAAVLLASISACEAGHAELLS